MSEALIRTVAVLAAVAVAAGPALVDAAKSWLKSAAGRLPSPAPGSAPTGGKEPVNDVHLIVDVARRLQEAGNAEGSALCHKLIEVLLRPEAAK